MDMGLIDIAYIRPRLRPFFCSVGCIPVWKAGGPNILLSRKGRRDDTNNSVQWYVLTSVADPVGSGPFWSDRDPDVWERIRILALVNDPISTFWYVKRKILQISLLFNFLIHENTF
jgi:hypothetical protein